MVCWGWAGGYTTNPRLGWKSLLEFRVPEVNSDHPPRKATVTILVNMIFEMIDGLILVDIIFEMVDGLEVEIDIRYMADDFEV